jgi:5,10-methylenetetrahydromethanopterin reductase
VNATAPLPRRPRIAAAFPPRLEIVEQARAAEAFGYEGVWLFDSPALYTDIWVALARVAENTEHVRLGASVIVASGRHPMVTASAVAAIEELAPGRLAVAFGTGFTGRATLGLKPMRWAEVAQYIRQLRGLLACEVVEIDGRPCQMIHSPGYAPPRPIATPIWLAATGPKGFAVARELDIRNMIVAGIQGSGNRAGLEEIACMVLGSVLRPGEDHSSRRLIEAVAPSFLVGYHNTLEYRPADIGRFPGGEAWAAGIAAERADRERHLAIHEGHLCHVTERDRPLVEQAGAALLQVGWTGDPESIGARLDEAAAAGITEVIYVPAGPDIHGELEAFAAAARR